MTREDTCLPTVDRNEVSVFLPGQAPRRLPAIILSPGFGGTRELEGSSLRLCEEAVRAGMAFVSFSPFSFGGTPGADADFTYGRWSSNLEDVVTWVGGQPWADATRIGCFAVSSGTTTALRLAQRSGTLRFVISVATSISTHVGMKDCPHRRFLIEALEKHSEEVPTYFGKKVGRAFYVDAETNAPVFL